MSEQEGGVAQAAEEAVEAAEVPTPTASWDWLVRIVHWSVAILFAVNYFMTKDGESTLADIEVNGEELFPWNGYLIHEYIGWAIVALVCGRILWGFIAKGPARISSFFPTPKRVMEHVHELKTRTPPAQVGHNPFGACAIFLMWFGLLTASLSGWGMDTDWAWDNDYSDALFDYHYLIVDLTFYLVCIHITAVILMSFWGKRNLVKAMVRGRF